MQPCVLPQQRALPSAAAQLRGTCPVARRRCFRCVVSCSAVPEAHRRALLASSLSALLLPGAAHALIPDDDDEELVQKAKGKRSDRIKVEKATEKTFSREAGLNKDDLAGIQRAINRLAKSGAEIDENKLKDAATTLNDKWVSQFETAASNIAGSDSSKSASQVLQAIQSLQSSAKSGDARDAKQKFVAAVNAIQSWVGSSGVEGIRGL